MASFHNWTGDELIDTQVPQFLNEDNVATQEKLDTKFNKSLDIAEASDLNNFKDEGFYCCNSNSRAETILNCPTNYAFGLMVWGKGEIFYQEVREFNRGSNQDYNNCWRRSYSYGGQGVWSNWQKVAYVATTLAGYGITDGMGKNATNSVSVTDILKRNINTSYLRLTGGNTFDKGAILQLCGGAYTANAGQFLLNAADSTQSATLLGNPSGLLKWKNKNIVRSINNIVADDNGNVSINVSGGGGSGSNITVDEEISSTSTNPVQNKAIYSALLNKVGIDEIFNGFALRSPTAPITWMQGSQTLGSLTASNYTGTALRATQDSDGNIINTTYAKKSDISGMVKSVNNVKPDSNGNVAITVSGGGNVTVDTALSATSTNPVQNRVIKEALDGKLSKTEIAAAALKDGAGNIIVNTYAKKTDISGMVKSVNGKEPDASGNVNVKEYTHPNSGVTAGSYRKVTVDTLGHVTAGENPILTVAEGGTGADNATSALSNLGILGAIVNASVSGKTITFTKKDNTKITINTQDTNNGIVAALLKQNGYAKFANGLILQWGYYKATSSSYTLTFPIAFSSKTCAVCVTNVNSGSGFPVTYTPNTTSIKIDNKCYENFWIAVGF